ncbi:hypothetical protein VB10N_39830 [Vibrio sp. 10N]|nr:hypothetical protein VB10N_39830 [Vibrio sp. 10N]
MICGARSFVFVVNEVTLSQNEIFMGPTVMEYTEETASNSANAENTRVLEKFLSILFL